MQKEYETERIILKILDETEAPKVLDYYIRNKIFLRELEPERNESFYTLQFHQNQLKNDLISIKRGNLLRFWVFKKENPNQVIGTLAFSNIIRGPFLSCFLGYKLDQKEINKGYMTEAIAKGIDVIFNKYGLHRIEANIMPKNKPSLRVVEKLGFCNEGISHRYLKINGKWEDHIHMVLLNTGVE